MNIRDARDACNGGPVWTSDDGSYSDHYILLPNDKMIYYGHDMLAPTYLSLEGSMKIREDPRYEWEPVWGTSDE